MLYLMTENEFAEMNATLDMATDAVIEAHEKINELEAEVKKAANPKWLAFEYANVRRLVIPVAVRASHGRMRLIAREVANGRDFFHSVPSGRERDFPVKSFLLDLISDMQPEMDPDGTDVHCTKYVTDQYFYGLEGAPKL